MELISIPNVSLVDASGRSIGVYTDDPNWWQQLEKQQKEQAQIVKKAIERESNLEKSNAVENFRALKATIGKDTTNLLSHMKIELGVLSHAESNELENPLKKEVHNEHESYQCDVIGETPLHIAIMYNDLTTIKFVVEECGYSVNQRSVNNDFVSGFTSKEAIKSINSSQYDGLAYYGEYPLALAACFSDKDIYDYLLSKGADPNLPDTNGNTVLHVLVINNKLDMFKYATKHPIKKADLTKKNNQSLTPLNLAAKLGRAELFTEMLELGNIEFWRYSNIQCAVYPLDGLDTIGDGGKIVSNSALSFIINGKTDDHLDMVQSGVVKRLLDDKWSIFARRCFFNRLAVAVIHLIFLTIAVYCRSADHANLNVYPEKAVTIVRYMSEIAVVLGCVYTIYLHIKEMYSQGFVFLVKNLVSEPANVFRLLSCILLLLAVPFRFITFSSSTDKTLNNRYIEDVLLILAVPCAWFYLLFFFRVASVTGPLIVMIYKMITGDILTFSYIYIINVLAFAISLFYLFKSVGGNVNTFERVEEVVVKTFQMSVGEFKSRVDEMTFVQYADYTKVIFVIFMVIVPLMLMNLLIAMMGETYNNIVMKSEKEWRRQWAFVVLLLESSFSADELKKFQVAYSLKLPTPKENGNDNLALMVIKKAKHTKGFIRRNNIGNWRKTVRKVIDLLKAKKCSAKDLFPRSESLDYFMKSNHSSMADIRNMDLHSSSRTKQSTDRPAGTASSKKQAKNVFSSNSSKVYPMIPAPLSNIEMGQLDLVDNNTKNVAAFSNMMKNVVNTNLEHIRTEETTVLKRDNSSTGSTKELIQSGRTSPDQV